MLASSSLYATHRCRNTSSSCSRFSSGYINRFVALKTHRSPMYNLLYTARSSANATMSAAATHTLYMGHRTRNRILKYFSASGFLHSIIRSRVYKTLVYNIIIRGTRRRWNVHTCNLYTLIY